MLFIAAKLDVNVSPDKRTVFLSNEKELFAKLRASLHHTWASVAGCCERSDLGGTGSGTRTTISTLFRPAERAKRQKVSADDGERRLEELI